MAKNLFSVTIFFIVFRETLEAAIIVSVLLGLVEQIVHEDDRTHRRLLIRKLRIQIFAGSALGLLVALAIGAAFIAVWFTKASNLWAKSETLWEGIFELIACIMIFVMGITMLKMDRAKAKWRVKLSRAFDKKQAIDGRTKTGKWVLFVLPFITVLREGMEAVVFVGGVSLGQSATSIPIAAIVGIICGLICGFLIYQFASRSTLTVFLVVMTNFILLIGAGLFSKAVGSFEQQVFNTLLGADVDDSGGTGPGSYRVQGNVWHLNCCSPEDAFGWSIFSAIFGWTNNATLGTVLSYVFYWLAAMVTLTYMKFKEVGNLSISMNSTDGVNIFCQQGRTRLFGRESAAAVHRRNARRIREGEARGEGEENKQSLGDVATLPR
ncbi:Plasma membrane iron permease [Termitomyces sp. J132]|nr:Plasma membrane iron permease [Termitomyces sp. J132]